MQICMVIQDSVQRSLQNPADLHRFAKIENLGDARVLRFESVDGQLVFNPAKVNKTKVPAFEMLLALCDFSNKSFLFSSKGTFSDFRSFRLRKSAKRA